MQTLTYEIVLSYLYVESALGVLRCRNELFYSLFSLISLPHISLLLLSFSLWFNTLLHCLFYTSAPLPALPRLSRLPLCLLIIPLFLSFIAIMYSPDAKWLFDSARDDGTVRGSELKMVVLIYLSPPCQGSILIESSCLFIHSAAIPLYFPWLSKQNLKNDLKMWSNNWYLRYLMVLLYHYASKHIETFKKNQVKGSFLNFLSQKHKYDTMFVRRLLA